MWVSITPSGGSAITLESKSRSRASSRHATAESESAWSSAVLVRTRGSAVDAMVAAQLVLNLVEPQHSGIGGGAFLLHWDTRARELITIDGRETAPAAARPDLFLKPDGTPMPFAEAVPGGRSVGVPGTLALLELAERTCQRSASGK